MSTYASGTSVSSEKSRNEIESTLRRYGADEFAYATNRNQAMVAFAAQGRRIRFTMPLPPIDAKEFTHTPKTGKRRAPAAATEAWEQGTRQRWRALALMIKAKLEAVESGIVTFEEEFGMYVLLPDGSTFGEWGSPQIAHAYETNTMPALMPGGPR